ncbi:response regulator [Dyadobacter bucti]|uniref:response regulator n=1 Tax=Dyadobacter bucti TaxID=2572203 RepID=UPI0011085387|nr:response regulator [Dyadobacter bucti]
MKPILVITGETFSYGIGMFVRSFLPGYPVLYAETMGKALEYIFKTKVELVVMNVYAYSEDDHFMIKFLRRAQPEVRILIFSHNDDETIEEQYLNAGVNCFLSKKMTTDEYQLAIDNLMNNETRETEGEHTTINKIKYE